MATVPPLKRVKRLLRYLALRAGLRVSQSMPARWAISIGRWLGALIYLCVGSEKRKALASLERAFPGVDEEQRARLARSSFEHLGRMVLELVREDAVAVVWPPDARAVLDAALARKKGVIFVSAHLGSWELLARHVARSGYPATTIAKETQEPRLTALLEKFRVASGLKSIWRGRPGAAISMLRVLKAGGILGFLIDQDTDVQSVWVPFFGRPAKTPRAPAELALRAGAPVILGFSIRQPGGEYLLSMEEVPVTGDATSLTADLTARIEAKIRVHPEQWVWLHQRWKSSPP